MSSKEIINVAANGSPAYVEENEFLFKDDIILKGVMQDFDNVDLIRNVIIDGNHNKFRQFYKYGKKSYYLGLPSVTFTSGNIDGGAEPEIVTALWLSYLISYGFPVPELEENEYFGTDDLPIEVTDGGVYTAKGTPAKPDALNLRDRAYLKLVSDLDAVVMEASSGMMKFSPTSYFRMLKRRRSSIRGWSTYYRLPNPLRGQTWTIDRDNFKIVSTKPVYVTITHPYDSDKSTTRLSHYVSVVDFGASNRHEYPYTKPPMMVDLVEPRLVQGEEVSTYLFLRGEKGLTYFIDGENATTNELLFPKPTEEGEKTSYIVHVEGKILEKQEWKWEITSDKEIIPIDEEYPEAIPLSELVVIPPGKSYRVTGKAETNNTTTTEDIYPFRITLGPNDIAQYYMKFRTIDPDLSPYPEDPFYEFLFAIPERESSALNGLALVNDREYPPDYMDSFPVVLLKDQNGWLDKRKDTTAYKSSQKLLKKTGAGVGTLCDSIRDSEGYVDEHVQTISYYQGVDLLTPNNDCKQYIYDFFDFCRWNSKYGKPSMTEESKIVGNGIFSRISAKRSPFGGNANLMKIQEQYFNTTIAWDWVDLEEIEAKLGKRGNIRISHAGAVNNYDRGYVYIDRSNGDGTANRLIVRNLRGKYDVRIHYKDKWDWAWMNYGTINDPDASELFPIPVVWGIYKENKVLQQEAIAGRTRNIIIFAGTYQKVKWYKRVLKIAAIIVSIAITMYTGFPGAAGFSFSSIAAMFTWEAIKTIAIQMAVGYVVGRLTRIVVEKVLAALGNDFLASLIAVVAAAYMNSFFSGEGLLSMSNILSSVTQVANASGNLALQELQNLYNEHTQFMEDYQNAMSEIDEKFKSLYGSGASIDKLKQFVLESPDIFEARTNMDTTEVGLSLFIEEFTDLYPYDYF